MDELTKQTEQLRRVVERGHMVEGLELYPGWKEVVLPELERMIAAYKAAAISPKLIGESHQHASIVGAHNALQSLLDILTGFKRVAIQASKEVEEIEEVVKENRKLGIHTRI